MGRMKDMAESATTLPPVPREYRGFNWEGFKTLYLREIRRFLKVGAQTLAAPVMTALLYMMVFVVAAQGAQAIHGHIPYAVFVAPGLVMMQVMNNAFANSSSSLLQSKMNGLIGDFMTPPLSPLEQTAAFALGAATRGLLVGAVTWLAVLPFARVGLSHPWAVAYFGTGASLILAFLGVMVGLWAEKIDHMATVTNFVVMPLTFLSGTFYLVERLPEPFRSFSHVNPFFYLIDGFRYGAIGRAEGSLAIGVALTAALALGLGGACYAMFRTGYKIKT